MEARRTSAPVGWLGEARGSHAQRGPPMVRVSTGTGETLGRVDYQKGTQSAFLLPTRAPRKPK